MSSFGIRKAEFF